MTTLSNDALNEIKARLADLYVGSDLRQAGLDVQALLDELGRVCGAVDKAGNVWSHCDHAEDCGEQENDDEDGTECDCGLEEIALWLAYARNGNEDELRRDINALPLYREMAADKAGAEP